MDYEWDEDKNKKNISQHRVDFRIVDHFDWDEALIVEDERYEYGEQRFIAVGFIDTTLYRMSFTYRDEVVRVINLRKATQLERKTYAEEI